MAIHETDTFRSLHALGEHVLAAGRYIAVGRIGLAVVPGGIATPPFGDDERVIAVVDGAIHVSTRGREREAPVTTLRAAAEFAGVALGAPAHVYKPVTPCQPDAPLNLDVGAYGDVVRWFGLIDDALTQFRAEIAEDDPSEAVLWPEHFDVAIRAADTNYGGLVGDAAVHRPYAYVGPPASLLDPSSGSFWNTPFGAASSDESRTAAEIVAFFHEGRRNVRRQMVEQRPISPG